MHLNKVFIFVALVLAVFMGQSEAGWLKKVGKKIVSKIWRKILVKLIYFNLKNIYSIQFFVGTCWSTYP